MSTPLQKKTTLATLPQEALKIILAHSHDLNSLLSTVASCRAFYAAFHTSPSSLIQALISREIDAAVLPEAIQALRAASFRRHHLQGSDLHLAMTPLFGEGRDALLNYRWSLADGVAAVRLHSITDIFASEFVLYYLFMLQGLSNCEQQDPPSIQELARIKRALYRFETYCSLFPPPEDPGDPGFKAAQISFFSSFSPWEREQLACVHESLWRQVTPAFNDLALHDISWGAYKTSYVDEFDDLYTERILSRGLRDICNISHAETYLQRYELLGCNMPNIANEFLHEAFVSYNSFLLTPDGSTSAIKRSKQPSTPFYHDPNLGPRKIWKWSHPNESRIDLAKEREYMSERACGYVFWDEERLDRTGLLDKDWADTIIETEEKINSMAPSFKEEQQSWEARSALFKKGIRGYWEKGKDPV
ncbi:hypothetical protein BGZ60DRAFT_388725 [Tricladium varicosporioides]|nr:hypothetical protein BGZ60DRAFT_388725 [Hymenoscyphus varicosporioides]